MPIHLSKQSKFSRSSSISFIFHLRHKKIYLQIYLWGKISSCSRYLSERCCQSAKYSKQTFDQLQGHWNPAPWEKKKSPCLCPRPSQNVKLGTTFMSLSCSDVKYMYKKAWCPCKVLALIIKPFLPFSLPSSGPRSLLKLRLFFLITQLLPQKENWRRRLQKLSRDLNILFSIALKFLHLKLIAFIISI